MSSKVYFSEIALIRPILIFSIIIGHSFAVFTDSAWWPLPIGMHTNDVLRCINPIVISFALQAFVFISGFLFSYKSDKLLTSWAEKMKFILAKFKRIYIPSLIFSTIYLLCFDTFSIESIYDIINGAGHLWFLPMLFWCYTFGALLINLIISPPTFLRFIILMIVSVVSLYLPDYFRIATGLHYFVYFVIGAWVYKFRNTFVHLFFSKPSTIIYGWILIALFCLVKCYLEYYCDWFTSSRLLSLFKTLTNSTLGILGSINLYFSAEYIIKKFTDIKPVRGDIWYGMYIYHQFFMIYLYYHTNLPEYLGNNAQYAILFITVFASITLVLVTLKSKLGRWLIG